jgi:SNF family Na+-dependent transporter
MGEGKDFLSVQNTIFGNYSLTVGALLMCLFVGWTWGVKPALDSLTSGGHRLPAAPLWSALVRFVCPLAILVVLGFIISGASF